MSVRAKFKVQSIKRVAWSPTAVVIQLSPEYDTRTPEDLRYAKTTPSGSIEMTVDNPIASDFLALGKKFYVDFTEVPVEETN